MAFRYLDRDVIAGFDKYKYSSVDTSPVSNYITHPFWNWVVQFCPRWIAPNLLTLSGFLLLVLQFAILTYYDCHLYASADDYPHYPPIPDWVWLASAGCMFVAHTLDGIDGKQARRTGSSTPLGELFDHGLDSWATLFMPIGAYSVFGRGDFSVDVHRVYFIVIGVMFTFTMTHWEKYNTGILFLPWGYDISQIGMTGCYLLAFFTGYAAWKFTVPYLNITSGQFFELLMHGTMLGMSLPMTFWNVYVGYRDKTGKMLSAYESLRPLFPALLLFSLFTIWGFNSSIDILKREPRLFYAATGSAYSNIACRFIVNQMSNTRAQAFNWLLIPLMGIVVAVLSLRLGIIELYLLWAYSIFATAAHIHYGICVVKQMAEHFHIYAFSLEKPPKHD